MQNVFDYITSEENAYRTVRVPMTDGWDWNMWEHIRRTFLYLNGKFSEGDNDESRPNRNIVLPLVRLRHRSEGFDVKDIAPFIDDLKAYYKSFLVRKFHDRWARQVGLDTFIDEMIETGINYGGVAVKQLSKVRPEVVPWQRFAFCDQTDFMKGPKCEKHNYSPDELMEMASRGWGETSNGATATLDEVITLSENEKSRVMVSGQKAATPGKYIEVYELHGMFPRWWLKDGDAPYEANSPQNKYVRQMQIVTYYKDENGQKQGLILYRGKEKKDPYRFHALEPVQGRALGVGGVEELFEPQMWVNYDMIRMKDLLDAAAKVIMATNGDLKGKNRLKDLENLEVLELGEGQTLTQVNTFPANIQLFEKARVEWEAHAQQLSAANDAILGKSPTAGTPFKLQELVTAESHSLHEYRKGKFATFLSELYRDWFLPYMAQEISKGSEFLSELELDELQAVADNLVTCEANKVIKAKILNGELIEDEEINSLKEEVRDGFMKGGNKKFISILKEELKDLPLDVAVNIAGKGKDLAGMTDKLVNIFRQVIGSVNPQTGQSILDDPRMANLFNQILEASGLSPIDFYQRPKPPPQAALPMSPLVDKPMPTLVNA